MKDINEKIKVNIEYRYLYDIEIYYDPHKTHLEYYQRKYHLNEGIAIKYPIVLIYYNNKHIQWDSSKYDVYVIKDILCRNISDDKVLDEFLNDDSLIIKFEQSYYCPEKCNIVYE